MKDAASKLQLQHLSMRVPWHDDKWPGTICNHPAENASCLILKNVHQNRDDAREMADAGKSFEELEQSAFPACIGERAGFMAPSGMWRKITHPHSAYSPPHKLFKPLLHEHAAYSADAIPFRWMLATNAQDIAENHDISIEPELEDKAQELMGFPTNWIEHGHNQRALLNTFFSAIESQQSLCFFYAKDTPLSDNPGRVIVGVGRITSVDEPIEYEYSDTPTMRAILWERPVTHSVRPDAKDGFLLPYHEIIELAAEDPSIDPERYTAFAPPDYFTEFSYSTEHVGHDAAIAALLSCAEALRRAEEVLPGSQHAKLAWIDDRINELWSLRGPCPGLGSVLRAFGIERGNFVAYDISKELEENEDPWPLMEQAFEEPDLLEGGLGRYLTGNTVKKWQKLSEERRALLKLLSRFDISTEQARRLYDSLEREKAGIEATDAEILANPYLLYELDRFSPNAIALSVIDRGVFPDEIVRKKHPLPEPSSLKDDPVENRRVRAIVVSALERAASEGNTLMPQRRVLEAIGKMELEPKCQVDEDLLPVVEESFGSVIDIVKMADETPAYQLTRLGTVGEVIRNQVEKRLHGKPLKLEADWRTRLDEKLNKPVREGDLAEKSARAEKVVALEKLASRRISVLLGPAGTGKTTLLSVLCEHPAIASGEVKLLAPTGKARVQLEQSTKIPTQTIAQFLIKLGGYDYRTGRYLLSNKPKVEVGKTLIIDEASMLTEEQLAAVLHIAKGVERLILVGDHRQLPPIGSGRPFVDIVDRLSPDGQEDGSNYAELTIQRRQVDTSDLDNGNGTLTSFADDLKGAARDDLLLASWFSGETLGAGADEIWDRLRSSEASHTLRLVSWEDGNDLHEKFLDVLAEELGLDGRNDSPGFEKSLGGSPFGPSANVFFSLRNHKEAKEAQSTDPIEAWQILSPHRGHAHGVYDLNRVIQQHFRQQKLEWALSPNRYRRIPKPAGPEGIVYGDKVMNIANGRRERVWPEEDALQYVANGEIGVVVGQYKGRNSKLKKSPRELKVVFSSQPGHEYSYGGKDFSLDGNNLLELAYAITVHKSQGSEFGKTFLVLPSDLRISRELLYTALTRQRSKVVILHQGDMSELKNLAEPSHSETATRLTNLFSPPEVVEINERFLENKLIHRTRAGDAVRSKSEVIIADLLFTKDLEYVYESKLEMTDGSFRYPDFTIDDAETGQRVYWEHLGLLNDQVYQERWQKKLEWYKEHDILTVEEGGGEAGMLVVTEDDEKGGIDSGGIEKIVEEVFGV